MNTQPEHTDALQTIVITGGGRGIGAALAQHYASPLTRLVLVGRSPETLAASAQNCRARGAEVHELVADVADAERFCPQLLAIDAQYRVDIVIANAGVSAGKTEQGSLEGYQNAGRVARTNLEGVMNTVAPLAEAMRLRGQGRIALVSSLAGLVPLPDSPSYCASKAGVISYGLALDTALRPQGVSVTVLCPGFIKSDMSDRYLGDKPFLLGTEQAAGKMAGWISARRRLVAFPWPLALAARIGGALPPFVRAWLLARVSRFAIRPEGQPD